VGVVRWNGMFATTTDRRVVEQVAPVDADVGGCAGVQPPRSPRVDLDARQRAPQCHEGARQRAVAGPPLDDWPRPRPHEGHDAVDGTAVDEEVLAQLVPAAHEAGGRGATGTGGIDRAWSTARGRASLALRGSGAHRTTTAGRRRVGTVVRSWLLARGHAGSVSRQVGAGQQDAARPGRATARARRRGERGPAPSAAADPDVDRHGAHAGRVGVPGGAGRPIFRATDFPGAPSPRVQVPARTGSVVGPLLSSTGAMCGVLSIRGGLDRLPGDGAVRAPGSRRRTR
jgi:hypothetical protein